MTTFQVGEYSLDIPCDVVLIGRGLVKQTAKTDPGFIVSLAFKHKGVPAGFVVQQFRAIRGRYRWRHYEYPTLRSMVEACRPGGRTLLDDLPDTWTSRPWWFMESSKLRELQLMLLID